MGLSAMVSVIVLLTMVAGFAAAFGYGKPRPLLRATRRVWRSTQTARFKPCRLGSRNRGNGISPVDDTSEDSMDGMSMVEGVTKGASSAEPEDIENSTCEVEGRTLVQSEAPSPFNWF